MDTRDVSIRLGKLEQSAALMHRELECLLILKGWAEVSVGNTVYQLKADDFLLINRRALHTIRRTSPNVAIIFRLGESFFEREAKEIAHCRYLCDPGCAALNHSTAYFGLKRLLIRLFLASIEEQDGFSLAFKAHLFQFLHHLQIHFREPENLRVPAEVPDKDDALVQCLTFMAESYHRPLRLEELARLHFMSPQYFSRYFKQKMGVGVLDYLTQLRLEHAHEALLYSEKSILKISMEAGFANAKSFSAAFQRAYGQTPSTYRKLHGRPEKGGEAESFHTFSVDHTANMQELLRSMQRYDLEAQPESQQSAQFNIPMSGATTSLLVRPDSLIDLGRLSSILREESVQQLRQAQAKLHFTHVRFRALFELSCEALHSSSFFHDYAHYQAFELFRELRLRPYWCLDFALIARAADPIQEEAYFFKRLSALLQFWSAHFSRKETQDWCVEFVCDPSADLQFFLTFYSRCRQLLKEKLGCRVGLLPLMQHSEQEWDYFNQLLAPLRQMACWPDFVSYCGFFKSEQFSCGLAAENLQSLADYHLRFYQKIRKSLQRHGDANCPVHMPQWNTLAGQDEVQSGTFFRSALILDALLNLCNRLSMVGFGLNTFEPALDRQVADTSILALYLYFLAKRPLFFVLDVFYRVGAHLLFQNEYCLVSQLDDGSYTILIYYPCYANPLDSLDAVYINQKCKQLQLLLQGLSEGLYQFKRITLSKDSAGIYGLWEKAGSPAVKDADLIEYLNSNVPEVFLYNDRIEGTYTLYQELSFNSIVLYQIKKI